MTSSSLASTESSRELQRIETLRRTRTLATALLGVMVLLFVATSVIGGHGFALLLLRAAAEAGIVGGLADWFAVTALFRHPLGLPIPHTAILPNNRDRIGAAVGRFVEQSFLTPTVLLPRLRASKPARRLADWLSQPQAVELLVDPIIALIPQIWRETASLGKFLDRALASQFRKLDAAPVVGQALRVVAASGEADILFERAAEAAARWCRDNRGQIDDIVRERSRWWVPKAIDRAIAAALLDGVTEFLDKMRQPDSAARRSFREGLTQLARDIAESPDYRDQVNAAKNRLLDHPDVRAWMASIRSEFSGMILGYVRSPQSRLRAALATTLASLGAALAADTEVQGRIDGLIEGVAGQAIARRSAIGGFIADVIKQWDAQTLSDRFELVIGSDLQFIRMNGTIVGAAVGAVIFLIDWFAGHWALIPALAAG
jgi:uncharacterized membrane-anchored protein YjiN (DUF445 family)